MAFRERPCHQSIHYPAAFAVLAGVSLGTLPERLCSEGDRGNHPQAPLAGGDQDVPHQARCRRPGAAHRGRDAGAGKATRGRLLDNAGAPLVIDEWAGALAAGAFEHSPRGYLKTLAVRCQAGDMSLRYAGVVPPLSSSGVRLLQGNNRPTPKPARRHRAKPCTSIASDS